MTNAAIFGRLFFDRNADNTENNGTGGFDFGVVGQTVQLVNASGVYVQSVVTDGTGAYHFLDIPPGNYFVQVPTAVGQATLVPKNVGGFAADSDANHERDHGQHRHKANARAEFAAAAPYAALLILVSGLPVYLLTTRMYLSR